MVFVMLFHINPQQAQAANYTFSQSSWSGGTTSSTMVHPTNETGWTQYSTSTNITAGSTITLNSSFGAGGWYSTGGTWTYRKKITIDHTKVSGSSALTNFPMLFNVTDSDLKYTGSGGGVGTTSGNDILFTSSDGTTLLNYEIESYASTTGATAAWVNIPSLSPTTDTTIYMYYGNASAAAESAGNITGTWDSNFKGVWHFPSTTTLGANDSTSNANNGSSTTTTASTGKIAGSASFNGSAFISVGTGSSLNITSQPVTVSSWVKPSSQPPTFQMIFDKDASYAFFLDSNSPPTNSLGFRSNINGSIVYANNNIITTGSWQHVAAVYASNTVSFYVNGSLASTTALSNAFSSNSNAAEIGRRFTNEQFFNGDMDEVRVSSAARSADWIATEYANQNSPSTFLSEASAVTNVKMLVSSPYDSGSSNNILNQVTWTEDSTLPANTSVTLALRTGSSTTTLAAASWTNIATSTPSTLTSNCSKASATITCSAGAIASSLKDGSGDEWFQYAVILNSSDGVYTPTISAVSVQYVVNGPPDFNSNYPTASAGGVYAYQNATTTDSSFGKVIIQYSVRDTDSTSGNSTPGYVTPSFQYNIGGSWTSITSGYLASGDLNNKAVSESSYTTYQATWDAKSQIPTNYLATAQVRVTVNDNELAGNTATQASANFTLDTTNPSASIRLDASSNIIYSTSTDSSIVSYLLSNNSTGTPDSLNAISGIWQSASSTSVSTSTAWTFASTTYPTVYFQARDAYNNGASTTAVAPYAPTNMDIKDISNTATGVYREFISWGVYSATSSAAFSKYEIYRSTDASSYSLLSTIIDSSLNYYADSAVATSSTYYYKIRTVDTDTDNSPYSSVVSDKPDGQGGTDITAPTISSVTVAQTQSTWATITWTTDELSNSTVGYSTTAGSWTSSQSSTSFLLSHSVTVSGLLPNTTYYFRVQSSDIVGNTATDNNGGNGYSFTTAGGPTISNTSVSAQATGASITWNTDRSSDSYVYYSTNSNLSSPQVAGNAALVSTSSTPSVFQHRVDLTGLSAATTYYFYVKSTDGNSNSSTDTNNGSYYSFRTVLDTQAPVISGISTPVISSTAAVVVWTTDEPATSRVSLGTATGSYSTSTPVDSTLTITHVVALSGLTASTKYYFVATSQDQAGNSTTSAENTFTSADANDIIYIGSGGASAGGTTSDITPPVISSIKTGTTTAFSVTVSFSTNESAVGIVQYGTSDKYGQSGAESSFTSTHNISLTGLRMGTKYHFKVVALDKAGNEADSVDGTFETQFLSDDLSSINIDDLYQYQEEIENQIESILPSIVPPFIGKVAISNVSQDSADISWQTNLKAYSSVQYASENDYNKDSEKPYPSESGDITTKATNHSLTLTGLTPNTVYHFRVKAYTLPKASSSSKDISFTTKAEDIKAHIAEVKIDSFRVVWSTADASDAVVEYKNLSNGQVNRKVDEQKKIFHEVTIDKLPSGTTFLVKVSSINNKGNLTENKVPLKVTTGTDNNAPTISGLKIESTLVPGKQDKVSTLIRWNTDEPASSAVYYEEGSGAPTNQHLANKAVGDQNAFVTDHVVVLGSLKAGAIYRIQVESSDSAGNLTAPTIKTIVVPRQSQSVTDIIFKNFEDSFKFLNTK